VGAQQDEFERTAMPHSSSLLRVARRLSSDAASAEDLVQETLLHAWRNFRQFRSGTNARAWLFRILLNAVYAQSRRQRAEPVTLGISSSAEERLPDFTASGMSEFDAADVARAFAALPARHRTVLLLGVVEGFTCREIAGILSLPVGTVMSRLSRARHALRVQLSSAAKCAGKGAS
jgi:RNA polymerase sigma-70 factor (ECF subfamily)